MSPPRSIAGPSAGANTHACQTAMLKRLRRLLLLALPAALVAVLLAAWLLWARTAITRENAERIRVGMTLAEVEAILGGMPTAFDDAREQVVYEMAVVLSNGRWVSRGLHERAVKALGHVGVTDVITLMGHYTSVAMTLAFYDVPDGATGMAR